MVVQRTPQWRSQRAPIGVAENEAGGRGVRPLYILAGVAIAVAGTYLFVQKQNRKRPVKEW